MYGCATASILSSARFDRFQVKVATSTGYVPPEKFAPTEDAARFHDLRTYHGEATISRQKIVDDQHGLQAWYLSRCRKKQLRSRS